MKKGFVFFLIVVVLTFVGGFYYHEALDQKIIYERESCYNYVQEMNRYGKITNKTFQPSEFLVITNDRKNK